MSGWANYPPALLASTMSRSYWDHARSMNDSTCSVARILAALASRRAPRPTSKKRGRFELLRLTAARNRVRPESRHKHRNRLTDSAAAAAGNGNDLPFKQIRRKHGRKDNELGIS